MPNITLLPTVTSATNATTFVVVDNRLTKRINYSTLKSQLAIDLLTLGFKGDPGTPGTPGTTGTNGVGVPQGGAGGDVLSKINSADYNTQWVTLSTVARTGDYFSLTNRPTAYTATSIDSFLDVDTSTTPPTNGQALVWNSVSSAWKPASVGAGIGLSTRTVVSGSTALTLSAGATENFQITGFKTYMLSKIATSYPAWVRIYTDAASRTADSTRTEGNDPLSGSGVIAEVITTSGALAQLITPGVIGFNNDTITTATVYIAVTNKGTTATAINVTLSLLQLET
jgi:hypothetical protein